MPITVEKVKNELTGLQYSIDQIQLSKINMDLRVESDVSFKKDLIENSEKYFETRDEKQKEWERKVTEAAGLEYDETKPFDRQKVLEILGDEIDEIPNPEQTDFSENQDEEIKNLVSQIEGVKKLDERMNSQLDDYLELFPPNQQSDFHYMLDALQNFVEWSGDYAKKIQLLENGRPSKEELEAFRNSSEFVSLCCNWLSSTVSTVLKYGFGGSESEMI